MRYTSLVPILLLSLTVISEATRSPVIIVPGILSSRIEAKLDKPSSQHFYCKRKSDWYTLWLNLEVFIRFENTCFVDNAKLIFDSDTGEYCNNYGVQTRIPGFGQTDSIEYLDDKHFVSFFHEMVTFLKGLDYVVGKSVRGAPFDWRFAANGLLKNGYYKALKQLIEETYAMNNNTPVTMIVHSMGGPVTHFFLSQVVNDSWKKTYVKQFISLSGAFGGSVKTLEALISGSKEDIFTANITLFRELERTFISSVWLLPHQSLWTDREVLVNTPLHDYTVNDIPQLFSDIGFNNGTRMYTELQDYYSTSFKPPNVKHFCFYGNQIKPQTVEKLKYNDKRFAEEENPDYEYGYGDGTVNIRSLKSCERWKESQPFEVILQEFEGLSHRDIVKDERVLKEIEKILMQT